MFKSLFFISVLFSVSNVFSQSASYTDPAAAYLRILMEKSGEGSYQQIGNFRVIGTSYLFGPQLNGSVYTPTEKAENVLMSYNTFNQQLEVYQDNNPDKPIIKQVNELDSFRLIADRKSAFKENLLFLNSFRLDSSKNFFLQQVATGKRFNLYKAYKSKLDYVSTNYVQSELRQFELTYDYYYSDATKAGLKKLKINNNSLKKEFSDITDISSLLDENLFKKNQEEVLKQIFTLINSK